MNTYKNRKIMKLRVICNMNVYSIAINDVGYNAKLFYLRS